MDENKTKQPNKKSPVPYIIGGVIVVLVAIGAVMVFRIKLLNTQLELGQEYLNNEQYEEAYSAYEQGLRIYPDSADAYLGVAEALIGQGKLTEAIGVLDEGISKTKSENLEQSRTVIMDQVFATYVLDSYLVNILPGKKQKLSVINRSEDMGFSVEWSSKDETIGTVDSNGMISAKNLGTTEIDARIGNDSWGYRDITATLIVGIMTTYLEEQGCDYVSNATDLEAPSFAYQEDEAGLRKYDGTLEVEQQNAKYSLKNCTVTDPDANGNVTYSIQCEVVVPTKFGILAGSKESKQEWYYNWQIIPPFLCDDYTGQVFTEQDLFGEDGLSIDSDVVWNNMTFHVEGSVNSEWTNDQEWEVTYSPLTTITWAQAPAIGEYTYEITVPKEYRGLVLAIDKKGITDYIDPEYEEEYDPDAAYTDSFFFDTLEDGSVRKAEDFYIIRICDFIR